MLIFTIESASGAPVDYTRYVPAGSLSVTDAINVPTTCDFVVVKSGAQFVVPERGLYVKVYSQKYGLYLFTGYITTTTEKAFIGLAGIGGVTPGKIYAYQVHCTSDEYLLNNKSIPFVPAFVNQTQGQILASLAEILTPGFF